MLDFAIIEVDDGLSVVELELGQSPEDASIGQAGNLIDPGPYPSFEDASDALINLQYEDEEEQK